MHGLKRASLLGLLLVCWCLSASAASARIIKVLPHYLDREGHHALSPSLYERDAYQAYLRRHPELRTALRFDVQWKASSATAPLKLRMEVRTSQVHITQPLVLECTVKKTRWFGRWTSLTVQGQAYREMGQLVAWRATLWEGDRSIAEQKSFLWQSF